MPCKERFLNGENELKTLHSKEMFKVCEAQHEDGVATISTCTSQNHYLSQQAPRTEPKLSAPPHATQTLHHQLKSLPDVSMLQASARSPSSPYTQTSKAC